MPHRYLVPFVSLGFVAAVFAAFATLLPSNADPFATGPTVDELWPRSSAWVESRLASMTLEQKVSQLFSVRAYSRFASTDDEEYRDLVDLVERFGIGGVTFFQGEPLEQAALANDLQERAEIPLLVSQDMEWGSGMRVEHGTTFPRAMALGATRDPELAYLAGYVTGREARALGTHHVLAPVADVNNNPNNPIINVRSFGESPQLVAQLASAFARGVQDAGAIATAKHFPGHGDTAIDSHVGLPVLPYGMDRLQQLELVPFQQLVNHGIMSVMTGHLAFPEVEPEANLPATLSPSVTTDLLRRQLGFNGLVVTDGLDMAGVTSQFSTGEVAVRAVIAGADLLLLSEDPYAAREAILRAVHDGRISEHQINASVMRLLRAKAWLHLDEERGVDFDNLRHTVGAANHLALSETIAQRSITLLRNERNLLPLDANERVLSLTLSDGSDPSVGGYFSSELRRRMPIGQVDERLLDERSDAADFAAALDAAEDYDLVVVPAFVYVRSWSGRIHLEEKNRDFLSRLIERGKPVVLVSFGNPYIVMELPQPEVYLAAYSASEASQRAVVNALVGLSDVGGRLPITIPELYRFGDGLDLQQRSLRTGYPAEVGLSGDRLGQIDAMLHSAISDRAFPGAAVAIGRGGVLTKLDGYGYFTYDMRHPVTPRSLFDLASLTKVVGTTTAAMKLYDDGAFRLEDRVVEYLPEFGQFGKDGVTIRHLLTHSAGLIPFRPFHVLGVITREALIDSVMAEKLVYRPGTESRYSDLGMITLMLVIEKITGQPFDEYVKTEIFEPLGMHDTSYRRTGSTDERVVPTELDDAFRGRLIQGEVHDETAWILGGVSGHAGLFSTAEDLAKFAYMLVNEGRVLGRQFLRPETIELFTHVQNERIGTRALGWDTQSPKGYSSAGERFGAGSFGHTGFTGTSIWIDPDDDLFVVLLTNRVYPTRQNRKIVDLRPRVSDLVHASIAGPPNFVLPAVEPFGRR